MLTIPPDLRDNFLPEFTQFHATVRHLFSTSIATCFARIPASRLKAWLDLSDVAEFAQTVGWSIQGEDVVIPPNGENNVKAGVVKETVELSRELRDGNGRNKTDLAAELTKLVAAAAV
jgi:translation initiation factor 3 subunit K